MKAKLINEVCDIARRSVAFDLGRLAIEASSLDDSRREEFNARIDHIRALQETINGMEVLDDEGLPL